MTTKITSDNIQPGTIVAASLAEGAGGGPKVSNVFIANVTYHVLDDTAITLDGGYIVINGAGFVNGCQVVIGSNAASSVTFVDSSTIRAQVGAAEAGSKTMYVTNPDGGTAIRLNALTYSGTPTWVTGSTLAGSIVDEAISIQLSATSDSNVTYQVQSGSTLPTGLSLAANGLLSGTVTGIEDETTYNFTIEAIDAENQESPRSFSITITFGDQYFNYTTLLLSGDGTNGANNNVFTDSSTNNFAITRNGNATQGTFSPFSVADGAWSNYFDGNGDELTLSTTTAAQIGSDDFSFECFVYPLKSTNSLAQGLISYGIVGTTSGSDYVSLQISPTGYLNFFYAQVNVVTLADPTLLPLNQFNHVAVCRSGSTLSMFVNGTRVATTTTSATVGSSGNRITIGGQWYANTAGRQLQGYLSNVRIVKSSSAYDATQTTITVPTSPLTAITNTSLLTCQSNRFIDNSTNAFAITPAGNTSVEPFSPFRPTASYSAATNGGSGYFDGTDDYLTLTANAAFNMGATGEFCIELWIFPTLISGSRGVIGNYKTISYPSNTNGFDIIWTGSGTLALRWGYPAYADTSGSPAVALKTWNHVVVCRDTSPRMSCYLNGTRWYTTTTNTGITDSSLSSFWVGWAGSSSGTSIPPFPGYISDARILKGSTPYDPAQTTITVPTAPLTNVTNTSLLCNFTNAGIFDATGKNNLETIGDAQIDTTTKKYGTGSMEFDGNGDYLYGSGNINTQMGTGAFTWECWCYITTIAAFQCFIDTRPIPTNGSSTGMGFILSTGTLTPIATTTGTILTSSINVTQNAWTHVALTRTSGGTLTIWVNGQSGGSVSNSSNLTDNALFVGGNSSSPHSAFVNGYIDDLRITKGVARYTANFTPPISAHALR